MFNKEVLKTKIELLMDYIKDAPDYMINIYYEYLKYYHFMIIQGSKYLSIYAFKPFPYENSNWRLRIVYDKNYLRYLSSEEVDEDEIGLFEDVFEMDVDEEISQMLDSLAALIKSKYDALNKK